MKYKMTRQFTQDIWDDLVTYGHLSDYMEFNGIPNRIDYPTIQGHADGIKVKVDLGPPWSYPYGSVLSIMKVTIKTKPDTPEIQAKAADVLSLLAKYMPPQIKEG